MIRLGDDPMRLQTVPFYRIQGRRKASRILCQPSVEPSRRLPAPHPRLGYHRRGSLQDGGSLKKRGSVTRSLFIQTYLEALDLDSLRTALFRLGNTDRQQAVLQARFGFGGVDLIRQLEATFEA